MQGRSVDDNGKRDGGHIAYDIEPDLCREHCLLVQSTELYESGTVLQKNVDGKFQIYDGTQEAVGILFSQKDAEFGDTRGLANVRLTVFKANQLVWATGLTELEIDSALESLKAAHIVPTFTG